MTDKIGVIDAFLERADAILIGGAMCFPFFTAQGHAVGASLCEEEGIEPAAARARRRRAHGLQLRAAASTSCSATRFAADAERRELDGVDVPDGWMGLDIGPRTAARYAAEIADAGTVFWNGPMGAFELEPFAAGTRAVAEAVADAPATHGRRRRRPRRGAGAVRPGRPGHPPLDRRRRVAGADRGQAAARSGGTVA